MAVRGLGHQHVGRPGPDAARRWVLLGTACSLAFERFVRLYRKYSEDQPRDQQGRWVDAGERQEPDSTGALAPSYVERAGDPLIDAITDLLIGVASNVHDILGDGEGMAYGRAFHNEFAAQVRELGVPDLSAEVTYDGGVERPYASPKAIRTDVTLRNYEGGIVAVTAIWDLKTGNAEISGARAREIREKVGVGTDTPLIEIQTRYGTRMKEMNDGLALWSHDRESDLPRAPEADRSRAAGRA